MGQLNFSVTGDLLLPLPITRCSISSIISHLFGCYLPPISFEVPHRSNIAHSPDPLILQWCNKVSRLGRSFLQKRPAATSEARTLSNTSMTESVESRIIVAGEQHNGAITTSAPPKGVPHIERQSIEAMKDITFGSVGAPFRH